MSTHNICFCGEIRVIVMWVPLCIWSYVQFTNGKGPEQSDYPCVVIRVSSAGLQYISGRPTQWSQRNRSASSVAAACSLTLVLLNPDMPQLHKQCRFRSVGF